MIGALSCLPAAGQRSALPPPDTAAPAPAHRTRLILKDGSYQVVMSYKVVGDRVRIISAERGGDVEEIPLTLVDLAATRRWADQHSQGQQSGEERPPVLDPELAREEAERAARSPVVATVPEGVLRLPEEDSVLALDTFQGVPELVPLPQNETDLNRTTGHNIVKTIIHPGAATHSILTLPGERAEVQLHVARPEFYVHLSEDPSADVSGPAMTVNTHGASAAQGRPRDPSRSRYVVVQVDVRQNARLVGSLQPGELDGGLPQENVTEVDSAPAPGGQWLKLTPRANLLIGEYCLMEVLGPHELNLSVWDFGVHPTAPENRDAVTPEQRRPATLERRRPE